jgi:hypothetical protein
MIDKIIWGYLLFFFIHFVVFLLYQFEILNIDETSMIRWGRLTDLLETVLLVITHIFTFSTYGAYGLGAFYILNIILLVLQFIFADWGLGRKILDLFWIAFYVILFLMDVCKITLTEIVSFISSSENISALEFLFNDTIIGSVILGVAIPVIRTLVLEAIHRNE